MLWKRRSLERSAHWTRAELLAHQDAGVHRLRRFALDRSPFYRRVHAGLESRPFHELPVVSKAELMANFDDVVTDRAVRLHDVEAYLARGVDRLFRSRYTVLATSGSTGLRGIFLFNPAEWIAALANIVRPPLWQGEEANPFRPRRIAVIASMVDWHYSAQVGKALAGGFLPTLRLDAADPLERLVARLNEWQPYALTIYPSVLRQLAAEQLAGRLHIAPAKIGTAAELLTLDDRRRAREAWNAPVHDTYGGTEYAPIAAECRYGRKHLVEDGAVIELERDRLLLTVLERRTQPLIRYEISDVVRSVEGDCECGRPFRLIDAVEGRIQDTLTFGEVPIHPNRFHEVLERLPASGWQVIQERNALRVHLTGLRDPASIAAVASAIEAMLAREGAVAPAIEVHEVDRLERGPTGKAPLIFRRSAASTGGR